MEQSTRGIGEHDMQEIIDKIIKILEHYRKTLERDIYENALLSERCYCEGEDYGYSKAIETIKNVVEEYNDGWIPVEQGLPKTSAKCWVTLDINGKLITRRDCFHNGDWEISMNKYVIAWQYEEKPKPYKPKGE